VARGRFPESPRSWLPFRLSRPSPPRKVWRGSRQILRGSTAASRAFENRFHFKMSIWATLPVCRTLTYPRSRRRRSHPWTVRSGIPVALAIVRMRLRTIPVSRSALRMRYRSRPMAFPSRRTCLPAGSTTRPDQTGAHQLFGRCSVPCAITRIQAARWICLRRALPWPGWSPSTSRRTPGRGTRPGRGRRSQA